MPQHVWVTRSEPGASRLARALRHRGHEVWCQPLLEIEDLAPGAPVDSEPSMVITLSAHAARNAVARGLHTQTSHALHVAVGAATAAELERAGVQALQPSQASSEGILNMAEVKALAPESVVWLWAGRGGRDLLQRTLAQRQRCKVVKFELYVRRRVSDLKFPSTTVTAVIASSVDGLEAFAEAWRAAGGAYNVALVAASPRIVEKAHELGFDRVVQSSGADPEAVCRAVDDIDRLTP